MPLTGTLADLPKLPEIPNTERSESESGTARADPVHDGTPTNKSGKNKPNVEQVGFKKSGTKKKVSKVGKRASSGLAQQPHQQEVSNQILEDLELFQMTISPKKDAFKVNRDLLFELRVKEKKESEMITKNTSANRVRPATASSNNIAGTNGRGTNLLLGQSSSSNLVKIGLPGRPKTADSYLTNKNKNNATASNNNNNNNAIDAASFVEYRPDTREPWRESADAFFARRKPADPEAHLNRLRKKNRRKSFLKEFEADTATLYERRTFVPSYSMVSTSILSLNADLAASEAAVRRKRKEMADGRKIDVFGDESFKTSAKVDVTHVCTRDLSGSQYGAGFTSWAHSSESSPADLSQNRHRYPSQQVGGSGTHDSLPQLFGDTKSHNPGRRRSSNVQFDASVGFSSKEQQDMLHHHQTSSAFSTSPTTRSSSSGALVLDMENILLENRVDHGPSTTDEELGIIADDEDDDEDTIIQKLLDAKSESVALPNQRPFTPTTPGHPPLRPHGNPPLVAGEEEEQIDIEAGHPDSDDDDDGMDVDESLYFGSEARTAFFEKYRQLSYLLNQETSISASQSASFRSYKNVAATSRPQSALSFTSHSKSFSASRTELMGFSFPSLTRFAHFPIPSDILSSFLIHPLILSHPSFYPFSPTLSSPFTHPIIPYLTSSLFPVPDHPLISFHPSSHLLSPILLSPLSRPPSYQRSITVAAASFSHQCVNTRSWTNGLCCTDR